MALTQQQIIEARQKYGIPQQGISTQRQQTNRLDEIKKLRAEKQQADFEAKPLTERVATKLEERADTVGEAQQRSKTGKQTNIETRLQTFGQGLGAVGDVIHEGVKSIPLVGSAIKGVEDYVGKTIAEKTKNDPAIQYLKDKWESLSERERANLGAFGNIVGSVLGGVGAKETAVLGKDLVKGALEKTASYVAKKGERAIAKESEDIWNAIQPKLSSTAQAEARKQGLITESKFGTTKLLPDEEDKTLIETAKGVFDPKAPVSKQIESISQSVGDLNKDIKSAILQRDGVFTSKELKSMFNDVKNSDKAKRAVVFGGDSNLEKAYDSMIEGFMRTLDKYPKKYSGLFEARQEFDRLANQFIPKAFDAEARDTVKKVALRDIRKAANDFIADRLKGGEAITSALTREHQLLTILDNISEKAPKVGSKAFERWAKENPTAATILKYGIGGTALGVTGDLISH